MRGTSAWTQLATPPWFPSWRWSTPPLRSARDRGGQAGGGPRTSAPRRRRRRRGGRWRSAQRRRLRSGDSRRRGAERGAKRPLAPSSRTAMRSKHKLSTQARLLLAVAKAAPRPVLEKMPTAWQRHGDMPLSTRAGHGGSGPSPISTHTAAQRLLLTENANRASGAAHACRDRDSEQSRRQRE